MVIIVTGTPGTGKTTFAQKLAATEGYRYLDLTAFCKEHNLFESYDEARDTHVIDEDKLLAKLLPKLAAHPDTVVDGHFSHDIPPDMVQTCYVTKTQLPELKRRLEARGYSAAKVRENLDAEIFDTCQQEAIEHGHKPVVVWTDK